MLLVSVVSMLRRRSSKRAALMANMVCVRHRR
jgi:hypothetical protein